MSLDAITLVSGALVAFLLALLPLFKLFLDHLEDHDG